MTASQFYKYVAERGGVPQSFARQWTELIFDCLREVVLSEDFFRLGRVCDFRHVIFKSRVTRNPVTGEYCLSPDKDTISVKLHNSVRRDFLKGLWDGTYKSNVEGGPKQSVPLSKEECISRGYNLYHYKVPGVRMKVLGYDPYKLIEDRENRAKAEETASSENKE